MDTNDLITSTHPGVVQSGSPGKRLLPGLLLAGMSLGTAWAIRGQFGHEQGAAWAGSIGALSVVLIAKRADWYNKAFKVTLAAALGWGIGGIMSYGKIVGFGRATDFGNVYYGLMMLFVVGGLHGFLGGGLFGLALSDSPARRVKWHQLIIELVVGALLLYFFLVEQWGWLMTPPRSELWAACLGMALALSWYMARHNQSSAFRVAIFGGLGGGFGFAFGNFLQVLGNAAAIPFNFWNVMEYSIGFFGGVGMAYGTFTSLWPTATTDQVKRNSILFPLLMLALVIPFVVWEQSFERKRLMETFTPLLSSDAGPVSQTVQLLVMALVLVTAGIWIRKYYAEQASLSYTGIRLFFLSHFSLYTLLSLLITGAFLSPYRPEQYIYLVNLLIIGLLIGKARHGFSPHGIKAGKWATGLAIVVIFIAILAMILINSHEEMTGAQRRFE
ncbi:hypothetical protein GCM10023189_55570 [Nibrella saemangeumensis]|uniref:DUF3464 family protein n=1 Tax=Nibrella saemangeumensis TaxID=1084526 RepID=A0ABP8NPS9_9BACT